MVKSRAAFEGHFANEASARIAFESGTHSPWVLALLTEMEHDVIVTNPRKLRMIFKSESKNDRVDAQELACVARLGRGDIIRQMARAGVAPPRPDLMDKIWTKARIHKSIDVLHGADPVLSSHALLDLSIANCLGRFQPEISRAAPRPPSGDSVRVCCAPSVRPTQDYDAEPCSCREHSRCMSASCPQSEKLWTVRTTTPGPMQ